MHGAGTAQRSAAAELRAGHPEVVAQLTQMGYRLVEHPPWGAVELIEIANRRLRGASDSRLPAGAAAGY